jgi:hypothetical protein
MTTRSASEVSPRARRVWDRLTEWYGTRLAEMYGPNPPRDWRRLVDRSNDFDVRRALNTIRTKHPSHPPTLPEFESALRPPPPVHREPHEATLQERLVAHVMKTRHLPPAQIIARWTFLYERVQWTDRENRPRDELAKCIGVFVPPVEGASGFSVSASELTGP